MPLCDQTGCALSPGEIQYTSVTSYDAHVHMYVCVHITCVLVSVGNFIALSLHVSF